MRLCMERVLPPCRERTVKFSLPPIEAARTGQACGPSPRDVSLAMDAVTSALARGEITPGEAETIAGVVDTFVRAIETTKKDGSRFNLLQILRAGDDGDDNSKDDSDSGEYEEAGEYEEVGEYEETDDCHSKQEWNYEYFNQDGRFCCRFAAGAAIGNNWFNSRLQA